MPFPAPGKALPVSSATLTGSAFPGAGRHRTEGRQALLAALRRRQIDLLVGTHALLQGDVVFGRLGLVIVDEQHRFGVAQRRYLLEQNPAADLLLMTATPIPRSLALTVYGDLELSVIRELPPGRFPVRTHLARLDRLPEVYARVRTELAAGGQVYFVAPRIGAPPASDGSDLSAVQDAAVLPGDAGCGERPPSNAASAAVAVHRLCAGPSPAAPSAVDLGIIVIFSSVGVTTRCSATSRQAVDGGMQRQRLWFPAFAGMPARKIQGLRDSSFASFGMAPSLQPSPRGRGLGSPKTKTLDPRSGRG